MVLWVECEDEYDFVVLLPFCGMSISIDNRVGIPTVTFSQLYRKKRSRLCRDALRYEIRTVVMFVDQMMNNKGGCGNVTVCYVRC